MKSRGILYLTLALGLAAAAPSGVGIAHAASDDEYNFSWLDPDKKIYVLQNRKFGKANRLLLSAMVGSGLSNAYRTVYAVDPRLAYYFSESLGIEGFYTIFSNSENSTFENLLVTTTSIPKVRESRSQYGGLIHWAPWYAKINMFNKILYFDWYLSGGAGILHSAIDVRANKADPASYVFDDKVAFYLGTGHQYHLSRDWTVRLDFMGTFYQAPLNGTTGAETWFSHYTFAFGMGYRL